MSARTKDGLNISADLLEGYLHLGLVQSLSTNLVTISGTAETPFVLLRNPLGSGRNINLSQLFFSIDSTNARSVIRGYINPTVTADGTPATIVNNRLGGAASVMLGFTAPTVSANGTFAAIFIKYPNTDTSGVIRKLIIPPGVQMLLTVQNSQNNTPFAATAVWPELVAQ